MSSSRARPPPRLTIAIPTARTSIAETTPGARRLDRHDDRRGGQLRDGRVEQVCRPAELGDHRAEALGGRAGLERVAPRPRAPRATSARSPPSTSSSAHSASVTSSSRCVARGAGQVVDRLAHLDRVAGGPAEHLVHVGQQRDRRQAVAARDLDDRPRELPRAVEIRQ